MPTVKSRKATSAPSIPPTVMKTLDVNLVGLARETRAAQLAIAAGEHLLLLGKPGTAKSLFADQVFANFEGTVFKTQLSKNTDETSIVGMPDMKRLREDGEVHYKDNAPHTIFQSEWAFIDEMFDASDVLLRALLGILNERKFVRSNQTIDCKLMTCIATSNYARVNEITAAIIDRFALAVGMNDLTRKEREYLYNGMDFEHFQPSVKIGLKQLRQIQTMTPVIGLHPMYRDTTMKVAQDLEFSPRRERKAAKLLRASAAMNGRNDVDDSDLLNVLPLMVPIAADQGEYYKRVESVRKELRTILATVKKERAQFERLEELGDVPDTLQGADKAKDIQTRLVSLVEMEPVSDAVAQEMKKLEDRFKADYDSTLEAMGLSAPATTNPRLAKLKQQAEQMADQMNATTADVAEVYDPEDAPVDDE